VVGLARSGARRFQVGIYILEFSASDFSFFGTVVGFGFRFDLVRIRLRAFFMNSFAPTGGIDRFSYTRNA
jgi:hypothetical protein